MNNDYLLFEYEIANGNKVVSAIHWRDLTQFRLNFPDAVLLKR
jgi:hypothetical protein